MTTQSNLNIQLDTTAAGMPVLGRINAVLTQFAQAGLSYCHWKSNYHIDYALSGNEDVDVLVAEADFPEFTRILLAEEFRPAASVTSRTQPGVFHFLGNDPDTGTLINFHSYTHIVTGDHFLKSWTLPFERMLLAETSSVNGIEVPPKSSELVVFVIRNMIKHTTLFDLYLAIRSATATINEYHWLTSGDDIEAAIEKCQHHFPEIDGQDFALALSLLAQRGRLAQKIRLGFRFRNRLKKYRRYSGIQQSLKTVPALLKMAANKFGRKQKHMHFLTGGKIIALVGPQATGKSTIAAAVRAWLGAELSVRYIHAGKPPSTLLTFIPNALIPLIKRLIPGQTTVKVETQTDFHAMKHFSIVFIVRKLLLAYERRSVLQSAYRDSRNGKIVLSDRYPSDVTGAIDGATFSDEAIRLQSSGLKKALMQAERRLYKEICPPDLVLQLSIPVETAVQRNRTRDKKGGQTSEYVRLRHSMRRTPEFTGCPVLAISTDQEFDTMLLRLKQDIWARL